MIFIIKKSEVILRIVFLRKRTKLIARPCTYVKHTVLKKTHWPLLTPTVYQSINVTQNFVCLVNTRAARY